MSIEGLNVAKNIGIRIFVEEKITPPRVQEHFESPQPGPSGLSGQVRSVQA